jgi:nitrogen regulatory protein P-II 1
MKEIKAYVRPQRLEDVVGHLEEAGARDLTVIRVDAFAALADSVADTLRIVRKYPEKYSAVAKLEIVCRDEEVDRFVAIIREHGKHGLKGGGRIFVADIEQAINIRTDKRGEEAL